VIAWNGNQVAAILGTGGGSTREYNSVSTDTRSLATGALFVALAGDRFDGHDFVGVARDAGAVGVVVQRDGLAVEGLEVFQVDDTLIALGQLARARRQQVKGPVVGVTGTNGKTSTKEMLAAAMGYRWSVHATRENLNNLIGVPLTILAAPLDCDALVVEAGASEPGEIARLRDILEPTIGVVTNVAAGHLEGFGSLESVLMEKCSLLDGVPVAVVGCDPPAMAAEARRRAQRVVTAGLSDAASMYPDSWGVDPDGRAWLTFRGVRVRLPVLGRHQADNAMISLAAAVESGVELTDAAAAIERVELPPGRCDLVRSGDRVILEDTYNSNPGSLMALLETAAALREDRPLVIVLGTMLELGEESDELHARMADAVMRLDPSIVAVVGEFVPAFERHAGQLSDRLITAADPDSLGRAVAERLEGSELVLVKGSRGVHMEGAVPHLLSSEEKPCSTTS
jgi:UDP-N-acetylmuramoyl-tripeptide--D-alanyl-D-alanine ligase